MGRTGDFVDGEDLSGIPLCDAGPGAPEDNVGVDAFPAGCKATRMRTVGLKTLEMNEAPIARRRLVGWCTSGRQECSDCVLPLDKRIRKVCNPN